MLFDDSLSEVNTDRNEPQARGSGELGPGVQVRALT